MDKRKLYIAGAAVGLGLIVLYFVRSKKASQSTQAGVPFIPAGLQTAPNNAVTSTNPYAGYYASDIGSIGLPGNVFQPNTTTPIAGAVNTTTPTTPTPPAPGNTVAQPIYYPTGSGPAWASGGGFHYPGTPAVVHAT